uniref:tRNA (cytosine(72)-C(5))-methyltransferase NSUN6-like n=1 Tax=Styela clava TaxID=7725 RepID=UPI00193AB7E7|nr:tRNA (cytosine(72)-C(5))-methyltransferase NSUN6-like [Styela clava]
MGEYFPPPGFTTVRFDPNKMIYDQAVSMLQNYIDKDLKYRDVPSHHDVSDMKIQQHPLIKDVLIIPNKSLQNIIPCTKEIIVDRACGMAVMRGAHVFAPGIISAPQNMNCGDKVSVHVDLEGKCLKGSLKYEGMKYFVGNGIAEFGRQQLFSSSSLNIQGIGIRMNEPIYLTPCLDQHSLPGAFFPQNLPSIVVGHVLNPPPDAIVLDMCASPGGKSTHLCSLLKGKGHVIALDRSESKVKKILENGKRLGYSDMLHSFVADSRNIHSETAIPLNDEKRSDFSPPYQSGSFTHILLDAPCSALGQRPRFPEYKIKSKSSISSYPALQWQLFKTAIKLLQGGGTIVYSTCTTTFGENEKMVENVLSEFSNMQLVEQEPHIGGFGRRSESRLSDDQLKKLQYFSMLPTEDEAVHPADRDTIGFFIAKFKKCETVVAK